MLFEVYLANARKFHTAHESCIPPNWKQMVKDGYTVKRDGKAVKV